MNTSIIETSKKRRDKLSIIAEILEIAKDGTLKTQIMYKANLSFAQLNEYLRFMLKTKLIQRLSNKGKEVYVATDKGVDFLQRQGELNEFLKTEDERPKNSAKTPPSNLLRKN